MEDITTTFKDVTDEYPQYVYNRSIPIRDDEFRDHKCTLFMDSEGGLIFVGYIRKVGYPSYVIKATENDIKSEELFYVLADTVNNRLQNKKIFNADNMSRDHGFHIGTYGMVYHSLITIETFYRFPHHGSDIMREIKNKEQAARLFSELIDWNIFSKKMDEIDRKASNCTWGCDQYPNLLDYLQIRDMDFTFLMLGDDKNVKEQYSRFIKHLYNEYQFQGALR